MATINAYPTLLKGALFEGQNKKVFLSSFNKNFQGEFNLKKRQMELVIFADCEVRDAVVDELDLAPIIKTPMKHSTILITLEKVAYVFDRFSGLEAIQSLFDTKEILKEKVIDGITSRQEKILSEACANVKGKQLLDLTKNGLLTPGQTTITKDNITKALDTIKAQIRAVYSEAGKTLDDFSSFEVFASPTFCGLIRDLKLATYNTQGETAFRTGYVGEVFGLKIYEHNNTNLFSLDSDSKLVNAEYIVVKTPDSVNFVQPYIDVKTFQGQEESAIIPDWFLKALVHYDAFNYNPYKLFSVKVEYKTGKNTDIVLTNTLASKIG